MHQRDCDRIVQALAVCTWITIAVLSLLPGSDRPHTGMSGHAEHVMAYLGSGLITRLGFRHTRSRWQVMAFSIAAGFFEICQIWIPGRHAGADDWFVSSVGALLGVVVAKVLVNRRAARSV